MEVVISILISFNILASGIIIQLMKIVNYEGYI